LAIDFNWGLSGTSGDGTSVSVNVGTQTINPNDLLIAVVVPESVNSTPPGDVQAPSGWVQLDDTALLMNFGGTIPATAAVFYKIADGSESGNYTFTWGNDAKCSWTLVDYSGVDTANPIFASAGQTTTDYVTETTAPSVAANAGDTLVNIWTTKGSTEPYVADPSTAVRANVDSNSSDHAEIMVADRTLSSSGQTGSDVMTEFYGNSGQRGFSIALNAALCFMPGTMIRTPDGEAKVETITRGDCVMTTDGRVERVSWIGRQTISMQFADPLRVLPIRIKTGALADNVPSRDLLLSPDHAVLVDGALIQAGALVNGTSIVRETNVPNTFTYYHVELDDHSLIFAENTSVETFVDNVDRLNFDNWAEHQSFYPDGKVIEELPYPRAKAQRQVPMSIRVNLGERAQLIGAAIGVAAA
jgi:hypothetical protein